MFRRAVRRGRGKGELEMERILEAEPLLPAASASVPATSRGHGGGGGGCGVQVVVSHPDHTFSLDERALSDLLLQEHIKDLPVVVVSVAGGYRMGKSFMLGLFLKYLSQKYGLEFSDDSDNWLGAEDEPLKGFSWRGGSERNTTGIVMWSEIFKATLPNGEKVAVILLDTQGAFDSESTVRDCATVFALSTMLSSVQIYNLSQNIQETDLQHLQMFTNYGQLALEDSGLTPFQRLQFLVRDWSFPYEATYGAEGGMKILQRRLKITDRQDSHMRAMRRHIESCFSSIGCFLMPHPGLIVANDEHFDGKLKDIERKFKISLQELVPMLLAPENLVLKLINGQPVKAKDLLQYFKSYMTIFQGNELPEPKSMLVATAEANNLTAVADAKEVYTKEMEEICGGDKPYLQTEMLEAEHRLVMDKVLDVFRSKKKLGGEELSESYSKGLIKDLEEVYRQYCAHNKSKHMLNGFHTPLVFAAILMVTYMVSGFLALVGFDLVATIFNWLLVVTLLVFVVWCYTRYSGYMRKFGVTIDAGASKIWENVLVSMYQRLILIEAPRAASRAHPETGASVGPPNSQTATRGELNKFNNPLKWLTRRRNINRAG